jgi:accessory gene regulator protein AgrB
LIIGWLSRFLSKYILNGLSQKQIDKYYVSLDDKQLQKKLKILLIYTFVLIFLIATAIYFGIIRDIVLSIFSFHIMRKLNNGHHFKNPDYCFIVTFGTIILAPILKFYLLQYIYIFLIIGIILLVLFAPYRQKNIRKKLLSLCFMLISLYLDPVITFSIFIFSVDTISLKKREELC